MKKGLCLLLIALLALPAIAWATTDEEYAAWAVEHGYVLHPEENGYIKLEADAVTSATVAKAGGVNYGAIEWDEDLQVAAIREFLKGGRYLGSPDFAQDETGYNYREMYQMATAINNVPSNTNLELVLDAQTLHLVGVSEAGTGKTIAFARNPYVSISWCRQLREEEEATYNYYASYGVTFDGQVVIYTAEDLQTTAGEDALIRLFDTYYPTLASNWGAYSATFAGLTDEAEIRAAKLGYITKTLSSGAMVVYEVVPTRIIVTAPFLMNMSPTMANAARFTTQQEGEDRYAYDLCISDALMDKLVAYKCAALDQPGGVDAVTAYYSAGMYPMLDQYCAGMGAPTSLELALSRTNAAGLKTQTTYVPHAQAGQ